MQENLKVEKAIKSKKVTIYLHNSIAIIYVYAS